MDDKSLKWKRKIRDSDTYEHLYICVYCVISVGKLPSETVSFWKLLRYELIKRQLILTKHPKSADKATSLPAKKPL